MAIKDLPNNERPREKMERYGSQSLSEVELLAIIIGTGSKGSSAIDIAHSLINSSGLYSLSNYSYEDFKNIRGIAKINALKLEALFELYRRIHSLKMDDEKVEISSKFIIDKYQTIIQNLDQEIFGIIIVDNNNKILFEKILYKGTKHKVNVSNKDIFKELMLKNANRFYIFHNHTGEDPSPSDYDIVFTANLIKECKNFDYHLLDHIIITKHHSFSFSQNENQ